jgi:hypothetical protein
MQTAAVIITAIAGLAGITAGIGPTLTAWARNRRNH